jgi:hypothetical protein
VIGLCSGAVHGLTLATTDARVAGVLMFDSYAFPGRRARWERTLRRALGAANPAMLGKAARWLKRKISSAAAAAMDDDMFASESQESPAAAFRRSMIQAVERKVAFLFFYTGTIHVTDRRRDQLGAFAREPFARQVDYAFDPEIDHNLTSLESQQRFMTATSDWVLRVARREAA